MTKVFKKGYRLEVTTWENDGDYYSTQVLESLTLPDVEFLVDLAKKFTSHNDSKNKGLGNTYLKEHQIEELHDEVLEQCTGKLSEWYDIFYSKECLMGFLHDRLLGYTIEDWDEDNFVRVYESHKVYYFEEDLVIEEVIL